MVRELRLGRKGAGVGRGECDGKGWNLKELYHN